MTTSNDERADDPTLSTGQVLGLAAAAAGGAAWLIQALTSERDDTPEATASLRGRLHAAVESEPVRRAEARGEALAPLVRQARAEVSALTARAQTDGAAVLGRAETSSRSQRKQAGKAAAALLERTARLTAALPTDTGDATKRLRQAQGSAVRQAGELSRSTAQTSAEVTTMVGERAKRLQERGLKAADQIGATLRDGSRDGASRAADARDQVVSLARASSKDVSSLLQDVRDEAQKTLPDVARTLADRAVDVGHQVADSATKAGKALGDRAHDASDRAPATDDLAGRAQATISDVTQRAAAVAAPALGKLGERLGHLTDDIRVDPAAVRDTLVGQSQSALRTVQEQVGRTAGNAPSGNAVEILQSRANGARDKGLDVAGLLQSNVPAFLQQVTDLLEQTTGKSGAVIKDVRRDGAKVVGDAEGQLQSTLDRLTAAAKHAAQVGDQAVAASSHFRGASKNAAHRTADAGKDGVESIIWLGAAGVAMYYGILNPEQRATVNRFGRKAGRTLGTLITEVRGRDQKF